MKRTITHYEIKEKLGAGGMGEVYRARDQKLGRDVALKILPVELAGDPERRARFEREARAVAALKHPNIVTVHSIEEADGVHFITMEYVEGATLSQEIVEGGLSLERFLEIAIPLADALSSAHAKGIAHRDLKPANVMRDGDGRLKVLDFGLAKLFDTDPENDETLATDPVTVTGEGKVVGTVAYMSPEQAEGQPVDARSDVFSLGVVLYEMATGKRPFQGKTNISTLSSILKDQPTSVTDLRPVYPRHLGRIIARCLAKDPDRRYQSALDVRNELEALRNEIVGGVPALPAGGPRRDEPESVPKSTVPSGVTLSRGVVVALGIVAVTAVSMVALVQNKRPEGTSESATAGDQAVAPSRVAEPPKPPGAVAPIPDDAKSIAVLPFANMSDDDSNEFFSDGLSEELMNVLAKVPGLRVAARTSSFYFKGHTGNVADIGRQLNVAHILEGSVRRAGNRVKVTAQLIKADDGFPIWTETYERELDDIFAIQEEIATEVAGAMQIALLGETQTELAKRPTRIVVAYDEYLAGKQNMATRNSEALLKAEEHFRKAIELDPEFAEAYAELAQSIHLQSGYGALNQDEANAKSLPLLERALALDPELGRAHAVLGLVEANLFKFEQAEKSFEKAIELNANDPMALMWYALQLRAMGDRAEARELLARAIEVDPLAPTPQLNKAYWLLQDGQPRAAELQFRRILDFEPRSAPAHIGLGNLYTSDGEHETAVEFFRKAISLDPGSIATRLALSQALQTSGQVDAAHDVLEETIALDPEHANTYFQLSQFHNANGRFDDALRAIFKALEHEPHNDLYKVFVIVYYATLDDAESAKKWLRKMDDADSPPVTMGLARGIFAELEGDDVSEATLSAFTVPNIPGLRHWAAFRYTEKGEPEKARALYAKMLPGLFEDPPNVTAANAQDAATLPFVLKRTGEHAHADELIRATDEFLATRSETVRRRQHWGTEVLLRVFQGRNDEALEVLERACNDGFVSWWWSSSDFSAAALSNDPRWQELIGRVRARVREQRQALAAEGLATPLPSP